jgi:hypothetical protein
MSCLTAILNAYYSLFRKTVCVLFLVSAMGIQVQAQPFGNEWINYNQTYFKIKVVNDGIYRIPYATLNANIPNLSSINPQQFALYHNGKAEPIFISQTGSTPLTTTDYIDFYGRKNIGDIDSVLYDKPGAQPHPYHSLFTDTSIYFLTISASTNNARFVVVPNDTVSPQPAKQDYFWHTARVTYTNSYFEGRPYYSGSDITFKSLFEESEGWGSTWTTGSTTSLTSALPTVSVFTTGPNAILRVGFGSRSDEPHNVVSSFNNTVQQTDNYYGFRFTRLEKNIATSSLLASNTYRLQETGGGVSSKQNIIHYAELIYPRKFEFGNATTFYFKMDATPSKQRIDVSLFNSSGTQPLLYDITNGYIIRSTDPVAATTKKFIYPASANAREFYLRADVAATFVSISKMDSVNFIDYSLPANQGNYLIITHKKLLKDSLNNNFIEQYRTYRDKVDNPTSGKYIARIYDIEQLYDQFGYGVPKSPLAIRNFVAFAEQTFSSTNAPEYLFMIGKGREYQRMRLGAALYNAIAYNQSLIPTFGYPGSDVLLAGKRGNNRPSLAVGRLAAENPYQIRDYLNKIKEYELQQSTFGDPHQNKLEKLWMKQVLHFGGGEEVFEQVLIKDFLNNYKGIVQDTFWGAHVTSYFKTSSAPIDITLSQVIKGRIDSGVSLMTFFGHAATTAFDISVDEPENYTNQGKYPVIISNGCFTGFIHDANQGYSERFVFAPNKGAIAFVATSSLSRTDGLDNFSTQLYKNFNKNVYNKSFGKALQRTAIQMDTLSNGGDFTSMVAYEMTLHGDPGIKLNQYDIPDYEIDNTSMYFTPSTINASVDTFEVNIINTNLGRAIRDTSFRVKLRRTYYDGATPIVTDYFNKYPATYYKDTFTFRLPTRVNNLGYGQNEFQLLVESDLDIDELSETNNGNIQQFSTYIESDDVLPIHPYEFAIVPKQNVVLKASTVNPFAPLRTYQFQIDTTELFNSSAKITGLVSQVGGVLHWQPSLTMRDSTVYYWRVSKDSVSPTDKFNWHYTSFLYLKDEYPGWNQSHFFQYTKNKMPQDFMYIDSADRIFKYFPNAYEIHVTCGWADATGGTIPASDLRWDFNSVNQHRFRMGGCGFLNGITFGVIDGKTFQPWVSQSTGTNFGKFGNYHCANKPLDQYGFDFLITGNHPTLGIPWTKVITNFLDSIPNGNYIVMYSDNKPVWTGMDPALVARLVSMGATSLPSYKSGTVIAPYTFFCEQGNPAVHDEAVGTSFSTAVNKDYTFLGRWNQGTMKSVKIGPASEWGSVHWRNYALENQSSDNQKIEIYGITGLNQEFKLLETTTLDTAITFINAQQFPYIRLNYVTQDDTTRTPAQLYYWRVLYKQAPEAAINPAAYFKVALDTISLGDSLDIQIALENVTDVPMDSMRTKYTIRNLGNGTTQDYIIKQDSLLGLDTIILHFKQQILNGAYTGLNKMVIEANPEDAEHQLEQFHFNNYAILDFSTTPDRINPLIDVTFDGRHIVSGDIVSARPNIVITLKDENKFLALDDTSLVKVYLKMPGQTVPVQYQYDNSTLTFYPATGNIAKNNRARAEFKPQLINDGTYELFVLDRDKSDNRSSPLGLKNEGPIFYNYRIAFEVVNKAMISNVLNYPNPFSTSTKFVFTITGSEVPDYMKIQIMTITGKVVKEITKEELGPMYVGTNITQYTWNGRDEYGDLLANGVYFYRVITNLNNKEMEKLQSSTKYLQNSNFDKYFKKGFGKLVILR